MTPTWSGSAFVACCPKCLRVISSQTRRVAEQRAAEHEAAGCGK